MALTYRGTRIGITADFSSQTMQTWIEQWKISSVGGKEKTSTKLESYIYPTYPSKGRGKKDFLRQTLRTFITSWLALQQNSESSLGRRKITKVWNLDLTEEKKSIREGKSEGEMKWNILFSYS